MKQKQFLRCAREVERRKEVPWGREEGASGEVWPGREVGIAGGTQVWLRCWRASQQVPEESSDFPKVIYTQEIGGRSRNRTESPPVPEQCSCTASPKWPERHTEPLCARPRQA